MSRSSAPNRNELKAEYDFASMKGGVRGQYAGRLQREGSNLVLLEPDIAKAFPSDAAVNEALRAVLGTRKELQQARRARGLGKKRKPARTARG